MKKLLILLLIAPMIGNSQLLNLPVSDAIILTGGESYTVPNGKVLQFVSGNRNSNGLTIFDDAEVDVNGSIFTYSVNGNVVFPAGTIITNTDYSYLYKSFVLFDLDAQNLAYNVPQQTTPTLYPNPTSSLLALNSDKEYDIEVYDMAGNKVMALTGNTIDMSHLSSATYIVKALDKVENEEVSYKVVKN